LEKKRKPKVNRTERLGSKVNRKDWRNLPSDQWNCATFHAYFADMNREKYGAETYVPLRNWGFEQRQLKSAIERYGPEVVREVCEQAFATYRPSRDYPQLNAGFVLSYMAAAILPRILAERDATKRKFEDAARGRPSTDELIAQL